MTDADQLELISKKLSLLAALQLSALQPDRNKTELVEFLAGFKLPDDEIAALLGTSKGSIQVLKHRLTSKKGANHGKQK